MRLEMNRMFGLCSKDGCRSHFSRDRNTKTGHSMAYEWVTGMGAKEQISPRRLCVPHSVADYAPHIQFGDK